MALKSVALLTSLSLSPTYCGKSSGVGEAGGSRSWSGSIPWAPDIACQYSMKSMLCRLRVAFVSYMS